MPRASIVDSEVKVKETGLGILKTQRPQVYFRIETTDKKGDVRYSVARKIDDFIWLHAILKAALPELPVPSLPPVADLKSWQPSVMARVRGNLNYFVQSLCSREELTRHPCVKVFLSAEEDDAAAQAHAAASLVKVPRKTHVFGDRKEARDFFSYRHIFMTQLDRRCSTFGTLLPSLCDYLHTKLSVYQSAFSLLEMNADLLVRTTSYAVLPTAGGDDLKKVAAAIMKRSSRYCATSEKMTREETQRCADSFGAVQAACNSSMEWLNVYASELPPQDESESNRSKSTDGQWRGRVAEDSLSVVRGEKERFDAFTKDSLASALVEFVKLQATYEKKVSRFWTGLTEELSAEFGISDNMLFSFEPTPEYLSEKMRRPPKASSGVFATEKAPRRASQDKKEGPGAARARAESASVGRSKWDNAEETQPIQAVKHAEEEKNKVREEKKRKAREERARVAAEAEAAAAAEAAVDLQRRTRRSNSKETKDADASTSSIHAGVGAGVARSVGSRKKWDDATETQAVKSAEEEKNKVREQRKRAAQEETLRLEQEAAAAKLSAAKNAAAAAEQRAAAAAARQQQKDEEARLLLQQKQEEAERLAREQQAAAAAIERANRRLAKQQREEAEIAAAVAEAEAERLRAAQRDSRRAAASAAPPPSASKSSKPTVDSSDGALAKLKRQEKDAADRSIEEEKVKQEVASLVEAWGMKYSGHGLRAYLGRMSEIFAVFPPCDEATRLNLRKAPASDVRKCYLQTVKHVHPDKLSSSSVREQLLGSMVFNLLNEAFIAFKQREGLT